MRNQNKKRKKSIDGHFSEFINLGFFSEKIKNLINIIQYMVKGILFQISVTIKLEKW